MWDEDGNMRSKGKGAGMRMELKLDEDGRERESGWMRCGQGWAKLVLIALERYSVALKRLTFNLR
jgi:hypothetical protein